MRIDSSEIQFKQFTAHGFVPEFWNPKVIARGLFRSLFHG